MIMDGALIGQQPNRLAKDAGIAIGPILFIIAVLGILAAAIAAGSGSFSTSTTGESNRTRAAAIVEIGQNLKAAFDRVMGTGVDIANVDVNPNNTSGEYSLFSSTGGGASPPSATLAATATSQWYYPSVVYPGIGDSTSTSGSRLAVLPVGSGVCYEINSKVNNMTTGSAGSSDIATSNPITGDPTGTAVLALSEWGGSDSVFKAKPTGCVYSSATSNYYFYQILGIQ
jgi:hypothetical protein